MVFLTFEKNHLHSTLSGNRSCLIAEKVQPVAFITNNSKRGKIFFNGEKTEKLLFEQGTPDFT
jgi:hypothetical protein